MLKHGLRCRSFITAAQPLSVICFRVRHAMQHATPSLDSAATGSAGFAHCGSTSNGYIRPRCSHTHTMLRCKNLVTAGVHPQSRPEQTETTTLRHLQSSQTRRPCGCQCCCRGIHMPLHTAFRTELRRRTASLHHEACSCLPCGVCFGAAQLVCRVRQQKASRPGA